MELAWSYLRVSSNDTENSRAAISLLPYGLSKADPV